MKIKITQTWHTDEVRVLVKAARDSGVWAYSLQVVNKARELCARRYGYLAASIMARSKTQSSPLGNPNSFARLAAPAGYGVPSFKEIVAPNAIGADDDRVNIGTAVTYAPYIEYGTSRMPARPFLRPAFYDTKHLANEALKTAMKKKAGKYFAAGSFSNSDSGSSISLLSILKKFVTDDTTNG